MLHRLAKQKSILTGGAVLAMLFAAGVYWGFWQRAHRLSSARAVATVVQEVEYDVQEAEPPKRSTIFKLRVYHLLVPIVFVLGVVSHFMVQVTPTTDAKEGLRMWGMPACVLSGLLLLWQCIQAGFPWQHWERGVVLLCKLVVLLCLGYVLGWTWPSDLLGGMKWSEAAGKVLPCVFLLLLFMDFVALPGEEQLALKRLGSKALALMTCGTVLGFVLLVVSFYRGYSGTQRAFLMGCGVVLYHAVHQIVLYGLMQVAPVQVSSGFAPYVVFGAFCVTGTAWFCSVLLGWPSGRAAIPAVVALVVMTVAVFQQGEVSWHAIKWPVLPRAEVLRYLVCGLLFFLFYERMYGDGMLKEGLVRAAGMVVLSLVLGWLSHWMQDDLPALRYFSEEDTRLQVRSVHALLYALALGLLAFFQHVKGHIIVQVLTYFAVVLLGNFALDLLDFVGRKLMGFVGCGSMPEEAYWRGKCLGGAMLVAFCFLELFFWKGYPLTSRALCLLSFLIVFVLMSACMAFSHQRIPAVLFSGVGHVLVLLVLYALGRKNALWWFLTYAMVALVVESVAWAHGEGSLGRFTPDRVRSAVLPAVDAKLFLVLALCLLPLGVLVLHSDQGIWEMVSSCSVVSVLLSLGVSYLVTAYAGKLGVPSTTVLHM